MKETQTLSYTMLVQLYEQVKEMEEETMKYLLMLKVGDNELERQYNYLARTSCIKYMIEDKLFTIWKEENKNG